MDRNYFTNKTIYIRYRKERICKKKKKKSYNINNIFCLLYLRFEKNGLDFAFKIYFFLDYLKVKSKYKPQETKSNFNIFLKMIY